MKFPVEISTVFILIQLSFRRMEISSRSFLFLVIIIWDWFGSGL